MSVVSGIKRILTLSCDESSRLVSEALDRKLPLAERVAVRAHFICCKPCRAFAKQIRVLGDAACDDSATADAQLSAAARNRMAEALSAAQPQEPPDGQ